MKCNKIRFIEPGERPYKRTFLNYFVYDRYIRTPSVGLNLLATIVKKEFDDTFMYSEAISKIVRNDVMDADVIFIGIFTFNANRGYFKKKDKGGCRHGRTSCVDELPGSCTLLRLCVAW